MSYFTSEQLIEWEAMEKAYYRWLESERALYENGFKAGWEAHRAYLESKGEHHDNRTSSE